MPNTKKTTKTKSPKTPTAKPPSTLPPSFIDPLAVAPAAVVNLVAELAGFVAMPVSYDPKLADKLLAAYRPRLLAIAPDRLRVPRLDVDAACRALLAVHPLTQLPSLRARFEAAAKAGDFNLDNLDHLKALPQILILAYRLADEAGAFASSAKIPAALDQESAAVEARLQKVCEHFFEDDPVLGPVLRRLSPGTSYHDRAHDLLGYAEIYESKHDIVSKDPVHYRASDLPDARRLAGQILGALGVAMTPEARASYDVLLRAWTLLEPVYFEVRELGLRFLRYDPRREERFPSVYSVGRPGQGRKAAKKDEPATEPTTATGG